MVVNLYAIIEAVVGIIICIACMVFVYKVTKNVYSYLDENQK